MGGSGDSLPEFRDLLRRARHAAGLTQEELAEKAGLSARGISDLERGARRMPQHLTISLLADALDLSDTERAAWERARRSSGRLPVSSTAAVPHSLSSLVGRERELSEITALLGDGRARLLTLTGSGGVGKTRLALSVGEHFRDACRQSIVFVSLAPLRNHREVLPAVATALSVIEQPGVPLRDQIQKQVSTQRLILIVDNAEHVTEAMPELAYLLGACPGLQILATSRAPLRLTGEHEYPVYPLALPNTKSAGSPLEQIACSEAVQLFVERARAIQPGFELSAQNAGEVEAICRKLDGLPLAIELAAARIRMFTPGELLARLDRPLALLTGGPRDLPDRQRTLRDTIGWSYDLLNEDEQMLFRKLSVCRGGWTVEAAEMLSDQGAAAIDNASALVEHSLARRMEQSGQPARFEMLETVREFGLERLTGRGELEHARSQHARHYLAWAERTAWAIYDDPAGDAVSRIEPDIDNIRAAFDWSLSSSQSDSELLDSALQTGCVLWAYWRARGQASEGRRWLELALSKPGASDEARMYGLNGAGYLAKEQGELPRAIAYHEESLAIALDRGSADQQVYALFGIGRAAMWHGDQQRAIAAFEQGLGLARQAQRSDWIRNLLAGIGMAWLRSGDDRRAEALLQEGLAIGRADGVDDPIIMMDVAHILTLRGECHAAMRLLIESLPIARAEGPSRLVANGLEEFAWLAIREQQPRRAARLLGAAEALRVTVGAPLPPADHARYESLAEPGKTQLGEPTWMDAFEAGAAMSADDAIAYALDPEPAGTERESSNALA